MISKKAIGTEVPTASNRLNTKYILKGRTEPDDPIRGVDVLFDLSDCGQINNAKSDHFPGTNEQEQIHQKLAEKMLPVLSFRRDSATRTDTDVSESVSGVDELLFYFVLRATY